MRLFVWVREGWSVIDEVLYVCVAPFWGIDEVRKVIDEVRDINGEQEHVIDEVPEAMREVENISVEGWEVSD